MEKIVDLLLEKGFFHKETYEKYGILTSNRFKGCGSKPLHEGK